ncbi:hypothetical protein ACFQ4O_01355 [Methylopila musalis]|uniref:Tetratricopeptide repeat protein n=1 Tax=Methylopila musalis TaxID=1134781 RepID=A0ABW3Z302_9HYPH
MSKLSDLEILNALEIQDHGSSELIIVFSSVNSNGFSFYKSFDGNDASKIFLRDPFDQWYQKGINEQIGSVHALADRIKEIKNHLSAKRVVCVGSSMGGYAALLFGSLIRADAVFACSPQTVLDIRLPHTPSVSYDAEEFFDLQPLLWKKQRHRPQVHILYGSDDIVDIWNAKRARRLDGDGRYPVAGQDHLAAAAAVASGDFASTVKALCVGAPVDISLPLDKGVEDPDVEKLVDKIVDAMYFNVNFKKVAIFAERLSDIRPNWAVPLNVLSVAYAKTGNLPDAVAAAELASSLAPKSITLATEAASLLLKVKRYDDAKIAFEKCLKLRSKHYAAFCGLGLVYAAKGEREQAEAMYLKAIDVRPRLQRARSLLDRLREGSEIVAISQSDIEVEDM